MRYVNITITSRRHGHDSNYAYINDGTTSRMTTYEEGMKLLREIEKDTHKLPTMSVNRFNRYICDIELWD